MLEELKDLAKEQKTKYQELAECENRVIAMFDSIARKSHGNWLLAAMVIKQNGFTRTCLRTSKTCFTITRDEDLNKARWLIK